MIEERMGRAGALEGDVMNPNGEIAMSNAPAINEVGQNNRGTQILRRDVVPQQEASQPTPKPAPPPPPETVRTDNAHEGRVGDAPVVQNINAIPPPGGSEKGGGRLER